MKKLNKIAKDITGKKFNRLIVIKPIKSTRYGIIWQCKCDCGIIKNVLGVNLRNGNVKSCGCLQIEYAKSHDMNGKNNPNYKDNRTNKIHYCIKCNKNQLSYNVCQFGKKQCKNCYLKTLKGKNNPNYIDGRTNHNKCLICFRHITKGAKYCLKCCRKIVGDKQKGRLNHRFGKSPTHGKFVKYGKTLFRSTWEYKYAKYLRRNHIHWRYEYKTFDLGNCTYTPDFYLIDKNKYIEIKGWWREHSLLRFNLFKKRYKNINIGLLMEKSLKKLNIL